jgi:hypothetical protein
MALSVAGIVVGVLLSATSAVAHDRGVLRLSTRELVVGNAVRVNGEKFSPSANLELVVVGTRGRIAVGKVTTDSAGRFQTDLDVPQHVAPGTYRLIAVADDGDEVATVDVTVTVWESDAILSAPADGPPTPSAEPPQLERAESPWVTGGALVSVVGALLLGLIALRRPTRHDRTVDA